MRLGKEATLKKICYLAVSLWATSAMLTAQATNQVFGSGYTGPWIDAAAAGQVITLFINSLNVPDAVASQLPLPTSLSGVSVSVKPTGGFVDATGYPTSLPILRVQAVGGAGAQYPHTAVTVQIPTATVKVTYQGKVMQDYPPQLTLNVHANGATGPDYLLTVSGGPYGHLLNLCDSVFGGFGFSTVADCSAVIIHGDGTPVSYSKPAKSGESIVVYATGLDGYDLETGAPFFVPPINGRTIFGYRLERPSDSPVAYLPLDHYIDPDYVGFVSGYVGLYQINLTVPPIPPQTHQCEYASDRNASIQLALGSNRMDPTFGYGADTRFKDGGPAFICVSP
jgi:hypothetical protein